MIVNDLNNYSLSMPRNDKSIICAANVFRTDL